MFWIINAILILIAIAFVLPVLLRKPKSLQDGSREQNIFIAKEQLSDLETRFEQGEIDQFTYQSTRDEIEQSLFDDVSETDLSTEDSQKKSSMLSSIFIVLLIPVIAVSVYWKVGNLAFTTAFDSKVAASQSVDNRVPRNADGTPDIDTMVALLQKKMEKNPDNAKGWYMLGRSYMVLKRYSEAAKSFERSLEVKPDSAEIMLALADSLAMTNEGTISGRPAKLIDQALELEPSNLTALWLGGMAARQQGNNLLAVERWKKVQEMVTDPTERKEVQSLITETMTQLTSEQKEKLGEVVAQQAPKKTNENQGTNKGITLNISLSDEMAAKVQPSDFVFVYAKAMSGPPMPLAAAKIQVKDLPTEVTLTDAMAMMPTLKLSAFPEVVVGARVSKSGQPISQNGDLYTEKRSIKLGMKVALVIDSVVSK